MYSDMDVMDAILGLLQGDDITFLPFERIVMREPLSDRDTPVRAIINTTDDRRFLIEIKELD